MSISLKNKVWIFFFITTTIFVFTTAAFIRNRYKIDDADCESTHNESTWETVFNQVEYVFRIMTNQGKIFNQSCISYLFFIYRNQYDLCLYF